MSKFRTPYTPSRSVQELSDETRRKFEELDKAFVIDSDGVVRNAIPTWNDMRMNAYAVRVPSSGSPNWQTLGSGGTFPNGAEVLNFTIGETVNVGTQVSHDYIAGTDIFPHVHYCFPFGYTTLSTDRVAWQLEGVIGSVNGAFRSFDITVEGGGGAIDKHYVTASERISGVGLGPSFIYCAKLTRVAPSSGTSPTNVAFLSHDFHFKSRGSYTRNEFSDIQGRRV